MRVVHMHQDEALTFQMLKKTGTSKRKDSLLYNSLKHFRYSVLSILNLAKKIYVHYSNVGFSKRLL